jgi:uncharacterized membrane protein YfcA
VLFPFYVHRDDCRTLWTPLVIKLFLWALPGIGLGIYLGGKVNRKNPKPVFSRVIFGILVFIGVVFLL